MTYDKIEKLMAQVNTIQIYTESRIHDLHGDLSSNKQAECEERIKRAKQDIFMLLLEDSK